MIGIIIQFISTSFENLHPENVRKFSKFVLIIHRDRFFPFLQGLNEPL